MPKVSSVIVPYASYLRVYEPLAAFAEPERGHWTRYARRTDRPSYQDELRRSLADLLPTPPVPVPVHESGDAFVLDVDGVVCVCPWRTRLRGWQALGDLAEELPARSWTRCCRPWCGARRARTTSGGWPATPTPARGSVRRPGRCR